MPEVTDRSELDCLILDDREWGLVLCALKAAQVRRWAIGAAETFSLQADFGDTAAKVERAMKAAGVAIPSWTPRPAI